jgi:hypothetical protein
LLFVLPVSSYAEVLVRWDQEQVPSRESLDISALLVPAKNSRAVENSLAQGYRVYLEVEAAAVPGFTPPSDRLAGIVVKGPVSPGQLSQLRQRLGSSGTRVLALEERGKWPHIRTNWVTKRNEVLQVSSRTAQPWIEQNAALVRIAQASQPGSAPLLTYPWRPITLSDVDEGPRLEDYLVAIADAGSVGADLVLPMHERFQRNLLLGKPDARRWWKEIRSYIDFYSWNLPNRYRPLANIAIVAADPMASFEVMNLLARHNLPFEIIAPERLQPAADGVQRGGSAAQGARPASPESQLERRRVRTAECVADRTRSRRATQDAGPRAPRDRRLNGITGSPPIKSLMTIGARDGSYLPTSRCRSRCASGEHSRWFGMSLRKGLPAAAPPHALYGIPAPAPNRRMVFLSQEMQRCVAFRLVRRCPLGRLVPLSEKRAIARRHRSVRTVQGFWPATFFTSPVRAGATPTESSPPRSKARRGRHCRT